MFRLIIHNNQLHLSTLFVPEGQLALQQDKQAKSTKWKENTRSTSVHPVITIVNIVIIIIFISSSNIIEVIFEGGAVQH